MFKGRRWVRWKKLITKEFTHTIHIWIFRYVLSTRKYIRGGETEKIMWKMFRLLDWLVAIWRWSLLISLLSRPRSIRLRGSFVDGHVSILVIIEHHVGETADLHGGRKKNRNIKKLTPCLHYARIECVGHNDHLYAVACSFTTRYVVINLTTCRRYAYGAFSWFLHSRKIILLIARNIFTCFVLQPNESPWIIEIPITPTQFMACL